MKPDVHHLPIFTEIPLGSQNSNSAPHDEYFFHKHALGDYSLLFGFLSMTGRVCECCSTNFQLTLFFKLCIFGNSPWIPLESQNSLIDCHWLRYCTGKIIIFVGNTEKRNWVICGKSSTSGNLLKLQVSLRDLFRIKAWTMVATLSLSNFGSTYCNSGDAKALMSVILAQSNLSRSRSFCNALSVSLQYFFWQGLSISAVIFCY